ncbi:optic atrophy 3 protein homolog isoform X2 [Penaeus chinensis]|uniref:optic atrophy 3 protein homolog isoform X2 n=1 Tax=Penaeus chinensis TaxID=139456 RepID=UPI001FB5A62E|nr:optic atrophy 3 protein homolog isoform X2 [Penaeus chinensis]
MVGFPIAKLVTLVIKQVSKPLANVAKTRAKNSHFFRTYMLMPPAQFYHWCEVRMKMYVMNLGRSSQGSTIPRLSEEAAIELGANLLGEGVIFGIAVAILGYEVVRQKEKERKKEQDESDFIISLEQRINDLAFANEELDTKVRELTRNMYATQHQLQIQGATLQMKAHEGQAGGASSGNLTRALVEAKNKISS